MLKKLDKNIYINQKLAKTIKIAIVRTDYHNELNNNLEKFCVNTLVENGILPENIKTFSVPGSWEIPIVTQQAAKSGKYNAIITFGVIVKGETHHFDMIANEVGRALMKISLKYNIPVALEVLAVYKIEHAEARAGQNAHNKGIEAATAVLKTLQVMQNE